MHDLLRLLLPGSFILAALIAASFLAWLALRERTVWDRALFATASAAMDFWPSAYACPDRSPSP
jgi:hypothetical protein